MPLAVVAPAPVVGWARDTLTVDLAGLGPTELGLRGRHQGANAAVADAMLEALGADITVFNPAFPTNKRTVYRGYLFVGDELLSESGMRHHPLTPMKTNLRGGHPTGG